MKKIAPQLVKSSFKCKICRATFWKEITLKNLLNTTNYDQICKFVDEVFKTYIEVLKHVAKEHSNNIRANISVKERKNLTEQDEKLISESKDIIEKLSNFKCFKCKKIVSLNDKFNDDLKEDQLCKLCTITAAYGD